MPKARLSRKAIQQRRHLRQRLTTRRAKAAPVSASFHPLDPDELAVLNWVNDAVSDFEYEVLGATERTSLGAMLVGSVWPQFSAANATSRDWLKLDVDIVLDAHASPETLADAELLFTLYAFVTWLHHNEGLPGPVAVAMHARLDERQPPALAAQRALLLEQLDLGLDGETLAVIQTQEARHAELLRRRRMN